MAATGITVRPMNDASFFVPLEFAIERNGISLAEGKKSGGEVNVVGNKQSLAGLKLQEKALMPASMVVVRQDLDDDAASFRLGATLASVEGAGRIIIASACTARGTVWTVEPISSNINDDREGKKRENLLQLGFPRQELLHSLHCLLFKIRFIVPAVSLRLVKA